MDPLDRHILSVCFFPALPRTHAETALLATEEDGTFLVRESSSCEGDYAISVLSAGQVHHVQVRRVDPGDAFFALGGAEKEEPRQLFHGLDELVQFYRFPAEDAFLLKTPLEGGVSLPPDTRRHGRTNLLHRATREGNTQIVQELTTCGHRSLEARNEEGQTALHIAAQLGIESVLKIFIQVGANVNAKDSASCTPLHYACMGNWEGAVRLLLDEGGANPQVRRSEDGWVPMHEAASRGFTQVVELLHSFHAPLRPRTTDNRLPIHLALEANHIDTIAFFDTGRPVNTGENKDDWYHGCLGRNEAQRILQLAAAASSTPSSCFFLIRRHSQKPQVYVLTLQNEGTQFNFVIEREGNFFYIDDGPYLESLEAVVSHYSRWSDGLPSILINPVGPTQTFAQQPTPRRSKGSNNNEEEEEPPPLPRRTPLPSSPRAMHDIANNNIRSPPSFDKGKIAAELIELGRKLGGGEYGEVFEGRLRIGATTFMDVAIKTLRNEEEMQEWTKRDFLQEATVMLALSHPNIVRILGLSWTPRILMVQELLSLGSLQDYLADHVADIDAVKDFPTWAAQIAAGMVYLQGKRFVHRDLAARNILLSSDRIAKISDFGLSRALGGDTDYYTASQGGRWPIKWYAPEACSHGTFSHASDVWSFGITLWEIYSFGETPYGDETTGREVIEMVERGERLPHPQGCPDPVYSLMKRTWAADPDHRPTFTFLHNFFQPADSPESPEASEPPPLEKTSSQESLTLIDLSS